MYVTSIRTTHSSVLKGMNCPYKDMWGLPRLLQLLLYTYQTTIIFGIMKDDSLLIHPKSLNPFLKLHISANLICSAKF